MRGVQSFGDKWAFWRITSAPCRERVRSSNGKIAAAVGLTAHELTRRIRSPRQAGGESVSQSPLKDKAFSSFLDQNPPFALRLKMSFADRAVKLGGNEARVPLHEGSIVLPDLEALLSGLNRA
jgi:hypothetical protein